VLLWTAPALPQAASVEQRLARVERLLDSGVLRDLLDRVEANERELRDLRDQVERLTHELERERLRQRDLYRDLDRRVLRIEGGKPSVPETAGTATPPETDANAGLRPAAPPVPAPPAAAASSDEGQAYRQARNLLLEERRPDAAIAAFERFLREHPESRYRANALYWLAEAHYGKGDYEGALRGFQALIGQYPDSDKAADAKLKLGYTFLALGRREEARRILQEVVEQHPDSSVARLARQKLRQLR
jgi:tol-pal system protein YbgF